VSFLEGWLNPAAFADVLREAQCEKIISTQDDKATMIFSERATFGERISETDYEEGLGPVLPSLVKSGVRVAVVATTDRQKALIEEFNAGLPADRKIICADSVPEIKAIAKTARYYYFRVASEQDESGVMNIPIIVKKILEAIGKLQIKDPQLILQLHKAARQFAIAA
jgi:hypothetical protein